MAFPSVCKFRSMKLHSQLLLHYRYSSPCFLISSIRCFSNTDRSESTQNFCILHNPHPLRDIRTICQAIPVISAHTRLYSGFYTEASEHEQRKEEISGEKDALYRDHIPTTFLQKSLLSVGAAAMAITNPWRGDMVATMGETTAQLALPGMRRKMMEDETGRRILEEMPRINTKTVDLNYLRSLPDETLGTVYVNWLDRHGCSPDEREPVHFVDDPELAYVMQRYREVHDLFHAVLGMPTNMLGEVAVKWVEALQLGLPMCALGAFFGPVRFGPKHMQKYLQTYLWWAIRNGTQSKFLMNVYFEEHWSDSLRQLQQELNIEPLPPTPLKMNR